MHLNITKLLFNVQYSERYFYAAEFLRLIRAHTHSETKTYHISVTRNRIDKNKQFYKDIYIVDKNNMKNVRNSV